MKFTRILVLIGGVAALVGGGLALRLRPRRVATAVPVSMSVTETIAASGRLRGETESSIGAPNGAARGRTLCAGGRPRAGASGHRPHGQRGAIGAVAAGQDRL